MSADVKKIISNIKDFTAQEKALLAHCLITSLETRQDDNVDDAWAEVAEKRFQELESGSVKSVSWQQIKKSVTQQNA